MVKRGWGDARTGGPIHVASATHVGNADYWCDGVADDVEIQAALDSLPATGGKITLSEGTFTVAAPVLLSATGQRIEGQGIDSTVIVGATNAITPLRMGALADSEAAKIAGLGVSRLTLEVPASATAAVALDVYGCQSPVIRDVKCLRGKAGLRLRSTDRSIFDHLIAKNYESYGLWLLQGDGTTQADDVTVAQFDGVDIDSDGNANRIGILFDQVLQGAISAVAFVSGTTYDVTCTFDTELVTSIAVNALAGLTLTTRQGGTFLSGTVASNLVSSGSSVTIRAAFASGDPTSDTKWNMSANEHNRILFNGGRINAGDAADGIGVQVSTGIRNTSFKGVLFRYCYKDLFCDQRSSDRMNVSFESCDFLGLSGGNSESTGIVLDIGKSNEVIVFDGVNKFDRKLKFLNCQANSPTVIINGIVEGFNLYTGGATYTVAGTPKIRNRGKRLIVSGTAAKNGLTEDSGVATAVTDGATVTHTLYTTPTSVRVSGTVAGEFASVTALAATTFTVAIKKHDGTAGTSQSVYWSADV